MIVLAIDPGSEQSAWCCYCSEKRRLVPPSKQGVSGRCDITENDELRRRIASLGNWPGYVRADVLVIEQIQCFGMPVGRTVFDTVFWSGRFVEAWGQRWQFVTRRQEKLSLCGSPRAKDANIRQALIDMHGGSRQAAVGTKKNPGPLYGARKDIWSAIAVAVVYLQQIREGKS